MHDGGSVNPLKSTLRRALGIGAGWGSLWLAFWLGVAIVIAMLSPDSIDPGEPTGLIVILGLMGLLSGLAFAGLAFVWAPAGIATELSLPRAAGLGVLATAIVQVGYLGHGDQGLAANLLMAFLFSLVGGIVTLAWCLTARLWLQFVALHSHS